MRRRIRAFGLVARDRRKPVDARENGGGFGRPVPHGAPVALCAPFGVGCHLDQQIGYVLVRCGSHAVPSEVVEYRRPVGARLSKIVNAAATVEGKYVVELAQAPSAFLASHPRRKPASVSLTSSNCSWLAWWMVQMMAWPASAKRLSNRTMLMAP